MQMMGRVPGEERAQSRRISFTCNHVAALSWMKLVQFVWMYLPRSKKFHGTNDELRLLLHLSQELGRLELQGIFSYRSSSTTRWTVVLLLTEITWLPTTALMPSLLHSRLTSSAIEVNGTTIAVVEPWVQFGNRGWFVHQCFCFYWGGFVQSYPYAVEGKYQVARASWWSASGWSCHILWARSSVYGYHRCHIWQRQQRRPEIIHFPRIFFSGQRSAGMHYTWKWRSCAGNAGWACLSWM